MFHDIAYKAKDRQDLLAGIEEFLDEVIVLPPGEWDPEIRIEPPKSLPSSDKRSALIPTRLIQITTRRKTKSIVVVQTKNSIASVEILIFGPILFHQGATKCTFQSVKCHLIFTLPHKLFQKVQTKRM